MFENISASYGTMSIGYTLCCVFECFLLSSLGNYEAAKEASKKYLMCLEDAAIYYSMISPGYVACPCLIQMLAFYIRMKMDKEIDSCFKALSRFEKAGYVIAKSAMKIFGSCCTNSNIKTEQIEDGFLPELYGWNEEKDQLLSNELENILLRS